MPTSKQEHTELAHRVDHHTTDPYSGELTAQKDTDTLSIEIGGDAEIVIRERWPEDDPEMLKIEFIAADGTRGELTVPRTAFNWL